MTTAEIDTLIGNCRRMRDSAHHYRQLPHVNLFGYMAAKCTELVSDARIELALLYRARSIS